MDHAIYVAKQGWFPRDQLPWFFVRSRTQTWSSWELSWILVESGRWIKYDQTIPERLSRTQIKRNKSTQNNARVDQGRYTMIHMYMYVYIYIHTLIHIDTYAHIHVYVYIYIQVFIHIHNMCVYIYICTYTYIHAYIHTYIHTYVT